MSNRHELFRLRFLRYAALAVAACGATGAMAQGNPATGAALYVQNTTIGGAQTNCQNCHGTNTVFLAYFTTRAVNEAASVGLLNGAITDNDGGMGAYAAWTPAQRADAMAYVFRGAMTAPLPPLTPPPGTVPATPTATPSTVMFGSTAVGARSSIVSVLFQNSTGSTITFANPSIAQGTGNVGDFRSAAVPASVTACPAAGGTLGPGMTCSFGAEFVPTAAGTRSATWLVNFAGGVVPRTLTLQGTATAAAAGSSSSANAPLNAGAGALDWMSLFGLLTLLGASRMRRR